MYRAIGHNTSFQNSETDEELEGSKRLRKLTLNYRPKNQKHLLEARE
jgi:hypothetical protein